MQIFSTLIRFWLYHPALLYGTSFLLGCYGFFQHSFLLIIPVVSLWLPFVVVSCQPLHRGLLKHLGLSFFTFLIAWGTAAVHYSFPSLTPSGVLGQAHVKIKRIGIQHTLFGERWLYSCHLVNFHPFSHSSSIASSLPCLISFPTQQQMRPLANQDYWVTGRLLQKNVGTYHLRVAPGNQWTAIPYSWSWAEQRYQWKQQVNHWIESQFSSRLSASFLKGLVTGEFDDYWMRQNFARFGLQHLLAISGFHFAIIAGFLNFILQRFLPLRACLVSLLVCLGVYCCFLGPQPSILRAWVMCSLTLLGSLLHKQTIALNSLGLALLAILGYDPLLCQELGFQLSFATTAAILLFYPPAQASLHSLFPKRELSEVMLMNAWNQHAYCVLTFLKQGLALTLAVNLLALPFTLYYFQQFPWMSVLYNLFFPFLASISLCLLLLGIFLSFLPFVSVLVHRFNDVYTDSLLQLTYQIPSEVDVYLQLTSFESHYLVFYLCLALLGGMIWKEKSALTSSQPTFNFI